MSAPSGKAFDAIQVFIRGLLPRALMMRVGNEGLQIKNGTDVVVLTFNRGQLDDFEQVLEGNQPTRYSSGIKSDLYFLIYVALGREGMIPDLRIVEVLFDEEDRDWLQTCRLSETRFSSDLAKALYEGLLELQSSLRLTLESEVEVPEVRRELGVVESLTAYYKQHGHLNSPDVHLESLSYLKAAALCRILRLQIAKAAANSPRAKRAFDQIIYEIVAEFWAGRPYNRIKLPPAVHDFMAQLTRPGPSAQPVHRSHVDIGPALEKLDIRLRDRWRGAWAALSSDNSDRVSQASNSMVEVLDQVIDRVRGTKEFREYLDDRFPEQAGLVLATRIWITEAKNGLQRVKHHTKEQSPQTAEDLMHQAEWIVSVLLRQIIRG